LEEKIRWCISLNEDFNNIIQKIKEGFNPEYAENEEAYEKELVNFLNLRFPNKIFRQGHTSSGLRIDIVIEGTYALELITVNNEGRLLSLMNQIRDSKFDYHQMAVVLIDLGRIPSEKIQDYANVYESLEVKTIIKKPIES
jgi:hypothetical protein